MAKFYKSPTTGLYSPVSADYDTAAYGSQNIVDVPDGVNPNLPQQPSGPNPNARQIAPPSTPTAVTHTDPAPTTTPTATATPDTTTTAAAAGGGDAGGGSVVSSPSTGALSGAAGGDTGAVDAASLLALQSASSGQMMAPANTPSQLRPTLGSGTPPQYNTSLAALLRAAGGGY